MMCAASVCCSFKKLARLPGSMTGSSSEIGLEALPEKAFYYQVDGKVCTALLHCESWFMNRSYGGSWFTIQESSTRFFINLILIFFGRPLHSFFVTAGGCRTWVCVPLIRLFSIFGTIVTELMISSFASILLSPSTWIFVFPIVTGVPNYQLPRTRESCRGLVFQLQGTSKDHTVLVLGCVGTNTIPSHSCYLSLLHMFGPQSSRSLELRAKEWKSVRSDYVRKFECKISFIMQRSSLWRDTILTQILTPWTENEDTTVWRSMALIKNRYRLHTLGCPARCDAP
jgi:hypothetical protein